MVNASLPEPWVDSSAVWFPCNDNLCNMENLRGFPGLFLKDLWFKILPGEFHDAISCWCSSWFRVMVIVEFLSLWCISFHQKKVNASRWSERVFSDARRSWMIPGNSGFFHLALRASVWRWAIGAMWWNTKDGHRKSVLGSDFVYMAFHVKKSWSSYLWKIISTYLYLVWS